MFANSGFYLQAKMDLDPKSWWHNPDFLLANGGRFVPGDAAPREVLSLDPWDTVRRDMIVLLLRELVARKVQGDMAELGVYRGLITKYAVDPIAGSTGMRVNFVKLQKEA